jgi:deoxyribodipyrimidine photo-lyase
MFKNFSISKFFPNYSILIKLYSKKKMQQAACNKQRVVILWFRNDLRLTDNLMLKESIDLINKNKIDKVVPFYCFDQDLFEGKSRLLQIQRCGILRRNFLIESVENLKKNLISKLKSNLLTSYGEPVSEIIKLIDHINEHNRVEQVICSREIPSEEVGLEINLKKQLDAKKIGLKLVWDQTLVHLDDLPFKTINQLPDMFTQFKKMVDLKVHELEFKSYFIVPNNFVLPTLIDSIDFDKHDLNSLKAQATPLNKSAIANLHGGEDEALKRTENYFFNSNGLKFYKNTRNGLIGTEYSSKLSLWLAIGCVSARYLYHRVKQYEREKNSNESTVHFVFELLWRDFFKFNGLKYGNKIFYLNGFKSNNSAASSSVYSDTKWKTCDNKWDKELFDKWCSGDTGYPFVDGILIFFLRTNN